MAASIAKLAIQIITDTSKMAAGFRDAQNRIQGFATGTKTAGESLGGLFAKGGAIGAGVFAAMKTVQLLERGLHFAVNEASKLQDRMAEVSMIAKDDTFNAVWKEFAETIGAAALPAVQLLAQELRGITEFIGGITGATEKLKELRAAEQAMAAAKELAAKDAKAMEEATKRQVALWKEADDLVRSLRTPGERMADEVANLQRLFDAGAIGAETVRRAAEQITKEFKTAEDTQKKIRELVKPNVGAFQKGTSAEFSARQEAVFATKQLAEGQKQQLAELKRANDLQKQQIAETQKIVDAVLNQPRFSPGRF